VAAARQAAAGFVLEGATSVLEAAVARYGSKASEKVEKAMHERKKGTLKSGRSGKKVKSRKQAIAIGLSQARKEGGKVPPKRSSKKYSRLCLCGL